MKGKLESQPVPAGVFDDGDDDIKSLQGANIRRIADLKRAPIFSPITKLVMCLYTCGFGFIKKKGSFLDTLDVDDDGKPDPETRQVSWALDGGKKVTFRPIAKAESVGIEEVYRRLEDDDWKAANPDHPITYLAYAMKHLGEVEAKLNPKAKHPFPLTRHFRFRKKKGGKVRSLYIPFGLEEEKKRHWLALWRKKK